jgi:hypothetical protein
MAEHSPTLAAGDWHPPEYLLDACPGNLYVWLATDDSAQVAAVRRVLQTRLRVPVGRGTARTNSLLPERIPPRFRWYLRFPRPAETLGRDIACLLDGQPPPTPAPRPPTAPLVRATAPPYRPSPADEELLRRLRGMLARGEVTSGFADSVLRQWEESRRVSAKQLAGLRRLVARAAERAAVPRVVGGGGRKPGSHRSSW